MHGWLLAGPQAEITYKPLLAALSWFPLAQGSAGAFPIDLCCEEEGGACSAKMKGTPS